MLKHSNLLAILCTFTVISIIFLIFLAYQFPWKYHLEVDIWGFYFPRLQYFIEHKSFGGIGSNEYLPGAMFFFLIPAIANIFGPDTWQNYLYGLFSVNILLILIQLLIYWKYNKLSPFTFLAILIFAGPIVLYRHDLYVSLILICSVLLWIAKKHYFSSFVLGIAASVKIFPILILPYYLILLLKNGKSKQILNITIIFLAGIMFIFLPYLLLGSNVSEIISALTLNSQKPVHAESLWGTILTFYNLFSNGFWARGLGSNGIYGIDPKYILLPLNFYNYFWIIPILFFYLFIYHKSGNILRTEIIFLILLLFIIFSKIVTPQYLFWFLTVFPLLNFAKKLNLKILATVLVLVIALITQYIYPLHYNELLGGFFKDGSSPQYFYLLTFRNFLLIGLFGVIFTLAFSNYNDKNT